LEDYRVKVQKVLMPAWLGKFYCWDVHIICKGNFIVETSIWQYIICKGNFIVETSIWQYIICKGPSKNHDLVVLRRFWLSWLGPLVFFLARF